MATKKKQDKDPYQGLNRAERRWLQMFDLVKEFTLRKNRLPISVDPEEAELGQWCAHQRKRHKLDAIPQDQINALSALPNWFWEPQEKRWLGMFKSLTNFVGQHEALPESSMLLGAWCGRQRKAYKEGRLTASQVKKLERIPNWTWQTGDAWENQYQRLLAYVRRNGQLPEE